jgi:hypothetical protein
MRRAQRASDFSALTPLIKGHYTTVDAPLFAGRFFQKVSQKTTSPVANGFLKQHKFGSNRRAVTRSNDRAVQPEWPPKSHRATRKAGPKKTKARRH